MSSEHDLPEMEVEAAAPEPAKKGFWKRMFSRAPDGESPEERAERLEVAMKELGDTIAQHEQRVSELEFDLAAERAKTDELAAERDAHAKEKAELEEQLAAAQREAASRTALQREVQRATKRASAAEQKLGKAQSLEADLAKATQAADAAKQAADAAKQAADAANKERDEAKSKLDAKTREVAKLGEQAEAAKAQLRVAVSETDTLRKQLEAAKAELDGAKSELTAAKSELTAAKSELTAAKSELTAAKSDLTAAKSALSEAQSSSVDQSRIDELTDKLEVQEAQASRMMNELSDMRDELEAALGDEMKAQERYTRIARVAAWLTRATQASFADWFGDGTSLAWRRWADAAAEESTDPPLSVDDLAEIVRELGAAESVHLERSGDGTPRLHIAGGAAEHPGSWSYDLIAALARIATGKRVSADQSGRAEDGARVMTLQ